MKDGFCYCRPSKKFFSSQIHVEYFLMLKRILNLSRKPIATIVAIIPFHELPQPFSQRNLWHKPKIPLQSHGIRIRGRRVAGLYGDELVKG